MIYRSIGVYCFPFKQIQGRCLYNRIHNIIATYTDTQCKFLLFDYLHKLAL